jgi:predicted dehydrogenase
VTLEVAIVGTGKVAERNYIPALLGHEDVSITCYSRTAERAEAVGERFGVQVATSLDELFARDPDAVFVLTGEQQRLEATQALLRYGPRRLFLEKPLVAREGQANVGVHDFWDGKELLQQAQEAGTEVAMVFNYRFFDQTQRAQRLIEERGFGLPVSVAALSHYATWSHVIDLIILLAGRVTQISGQEGGITRTHPETGTAPDISASFLLGEAATGTLLGSNGIHWDFPLFELIVAFEGGRIHLRGLDQEMEVLDYSGEIHETFTPNRESSRWDKYNLSFDKSVSAYLESVRNEDPPPVPGVAGLLELQFEASLKLSIAENRQVVLEDEFPIDPVR